MKILAAILLSIGCVFSLSDAIAEEPSKSSTSDVEALVGTLERYLKMGMPPANIDLETRAKNIRKRWLLVQHELIEDQVQPFLTARRDTQRAVLGLTMMNWTEHYDGALVTQVLPNSPAEKAGLSSRDVIVAWDGEPLNPLYPTSDLSDRMSRVYPQDKIRLRVKRADRMMDLEVIAAAMLPLGQTYPDEQQPSLVPCGGTASALLSDKSDAEVLWGNTNGVIAPCRVPMIVVPYRSQH
jgi:hypothetical protein